jgi:UDP-N-acetylmuramate--alanine ligase
MNLANIKYAYFLGIGGIGMSAIARYFNHIGVQVWGYDKTETPLTQNLVAEGISIHYTEDLNLMQTLPITPQNTLVVLTPAIPKAHQEWAWFIQKQFTIQKRAEVLGLLSENSLTIGIAGTHGKTTTSCLLAHLLMQSSVKCNAFLGGIASNYDSNLLLHPQADSLPLHKQYTVVEADEFDRSFLTLRPFFAAITSTDADHLDIYGNHSEMQESFLAYANKLRSDGTLLVKYDLDIIAQLSGNFKTYGLNPNAQIYAHNIRIKEAEHLFDLVLENGVVMENLSLGIPGLHNVENAVAASAIALMCGVNEEELRIGLLSFKGVKRRFEYRIKNENQVFIDDYAHHPTEIRAILNSVKRMYPHKKLVVAFQPHLFSRTRDFMDEFADSLSLADAVYLLPIYPARELPIEGVNSDLLLDKISCKEKALLDKPSLIDKIVGLNPELFVCLGAGDIDALVQPIERGLLNR